MNKDRVEILKREIIGADINDISKGQLLLAIEAGNLSEVVLERLYESLVAKREDCISEEITANTANVNDNFIELLKHMTVENFLESCKVLAVKYGLKYGQIADAGRMARPTLYAMIAGTFESDRIVAEAIVAIKEYYLRQYYAEILERI